MNRKKIIFSAVILAAFGFIFLFSPKSDLTKASVTDNVSGWAWFGANCTDPTQATCGTTTNPIGWVSFNDANPEISAAPNCTGVSYGVNVVGDQINGAAWIGVGENNVYTDCNTTEKSVGWIYFDSASGWPTVTGDLYGFPAKLAALGTGKYEIRGWAPIRTKNESGAEITLTWVRFKGANYNVVINSDKTVGIRDSLDPTKCAVGSTDHYAWAGNPSEAGLGWIDMCKVRFQPPTPPALSVDLEVATDSSTWLQNLTGYVPLNNVDFRATVSGTATGRITYKFDYTNDGRWDDTFNNITENPKIVGDVYNYSSVGTYTAKVEVNRGGRIATDTATIWVLPAVTPTPTPTVTPTPGPLPIWREIAPFLIPLLP